MSDILERAREEIDSRLKDVRADVTRLERAAAALSEGTRSANGRGSTSTTRRRRGRPPGRRSGNTRATEAAKLVANHPDGIMIADLAKLMDIKPNYLYRVLPELQKDGKVRKRGKVWLPA